MSDIIEKAFLIGKGLEERAGKVLNDLAKEGEKKVSGLPTTKEELENKLVEGGTRVAGKTIKHFKKDKEKIEGKVSEIIEGLFDKFKLVSRDDIDIIEKMASKAREKVDALEKRVEELEKKKSK